MSFEEKKMHLYLLQKVDILGALSVFFSKFLENQCYTCSFGFLLQENEKSEIQRFLKFTVTGFERGAGTRTTRPKWLRQAPNFLETKNKRKVDGSLFI